ncbi:PAS domain S-box protein [Proteobacteria bacterium 005FR1]|nr:PAS domain S-box protein [Proteobacteria bacterium 005FR1]
MAHSSITDNLADHERLSCRAVFDAILPPTFAISADDRVLFVHGDLSPYLQTADEHSAVFGLRKLSPSELSCPLRNAIERCRAERRKVVTYDVERTTDNHMSRITAQPALDLGEGAVIVCFEPLERIGRRDQAGVRRNGPDAARIAELERELDEARHALYVTEEKLSAANHDLRESHDATLAMNEELQLSNRELEHSTSELRFLNRRLEEKVEQLKVAHDDLVNFFASTEVATLFLDEELRIKRFTPIVEEILEITPAHRGLHVSKIEHELLHNGMVDDARGVLDDHVPRWRNIHGSDGRWFTRRVLPYRTDSLSVEGIVVTLVDITDLKNTEDALRESEARFREMADGLPQAVWVHDIEGQQELVNETFCNFFGVGREEMTGERWRKLVHPEDMDGYVRNFMKAVARREPFHAQARVKRADGQWRWFDSWGKPRFTASGEFKGFVGSSTDVTEQKETEAALRESEERFRILADNIAQLAWMADKHGHIFWYNQRWFDFTGTTPEQMLGMGWEGVPHPDFLQQVKAKYLGCIKSGEPWEDTFPMRGKDGQYRWFLSRALPVRDASGEIVRWLGTNTDVTQQLQVEQLLRESDQRKDEYLAMLGHELRNPLAAITAATALAKISQSEDPRLQHAIQVLERQSKHVTQIVDGLLEVSRIARGKIELGLKPLRIRDVLRSVLQDRIPHLEKRKLNLVQSYSDEDLWVAGDWVRLVQIFDNLLGNAIKFTEASGTVTVVTEACEGFALVKVIDTGVGIRQEMLSRIFEPFLQEAQDVARATGGLGLGLALAKSLTELHGGYIEARSEGAGQGAEFLVWLPLSRTHGKLPESAEPAKGVQKRVLIVEDNVDAADTLASLLELKGHLVSTARSAGEASQVLQAETFDLILCDIGLPGISGFDFARSLRSSGQLKNTRLVAVTGYGQPEDRKRSMEAGFDEHITKPVNLETLDILLAQH